MQTTGPSSKPKAVVTGGAGFIGSHIVDRLVELGYEVLVVDNLVSGSHGNVPAGVDLEEFDIADPAIGPLLARWRGGVVVHCAAQVSVVASIRDPLLDARSNVLGTARVVQAAAESGCRSFVYITTGGALYGEPRYLPCDETHPIEPLCPYGLSKWTGERYLDLLAPDSMLRLVLRLSNVYGPRQRADGEGGVVSIFADRMRSDLPVEINGDGQQTRDFVYVVDVADAVIKAITAKHSATVNVATERAVSVVELFERLASIAGYSKAPVFTAPRPADIRHSRLANGKALRELGWSPFTTLEAGLSQTFRVGYEGKPAPKA